MTAIEAALRIASRDHPSGLFDRIVGNYDGLVVAGATGLIADHVLEGLARRNVRPVALVDNNHQLWGRTIRGLSVMAPDEAVRRYPDAAYVAAIFTHTPLRRQLTSLGATRVVSYAHLFHRWPEAFLPYFAVEDPTAMLHDADDVRRAATVWADDESALLYASIINWFVTLNSEPVPQPLPARETYFPEMLAARSDEVFVDCGAFDGETTLTYATRSTGRYRSIIALEPDPLTFPRLSTATKTVDRVTAVNAAAGARAGLMSFVAAGSSSSHAAAAGPKGLAGRGPVVEVSVVRLDDLRPEPTYVKMDIEGFEREALAGARELLAGGNAAFAVTLYHRMSDLWQLPLYIHQHAPQMRLFLRHYAEDWAETICYAIPACRVRSQSL